MPSPPPAYVAVCGDGDPGTPHREAAREVGRRLAEAGVVVLTGGLDGVMAAVAEGVAQASGTVIGVLPGTEREAASGLSYALATGLGEARNAVLVAAADAVIAIGDAGWGTLSEIALARRAGKPVVGLATWTVRDVVPAATPSEAVRLVGRLLDGTDA